MNSAALVGADGTIQQRHDKLHLVPFGEFIPFERQLPWLRNVLPPIGDFSPGHNYTVFTLPASGSTSSLQPAVGCPSIKPASTGYGLIHH